MKFINILLYIIFMLMAFLKCFAISKQDIQAEASYWILAIGIIFLFNNLKLLKVQIPFLMLSYLFFLTMFLVYVVYYLTVDEFLNSLLFPLIFLTSYIFFRKYPQYVCFLKYIGLIAIVLGYYNLLRLSSMINENASRALQSNAGNTMVALLPFVFLWKNRIIRYIIILLIFYACLISIKRSCFIIFIAVIFVYLLLKNKINIYKGIIKYALILLFVGLLILPQIEIAQNMLDRLSEAVEDGGSGRDDLVIRCLEFQKESSLGEWLIGHGYLSFREDSWMKMSMSNTGAHNDFVEVLYDAGIIAYVLYLMIIIKIFKKIKYLRNSNHIALIPFSTCFCVFVLASLFVGPFVHFWYYLPLYILFGAMYALTFINDENNNIPHVHSLF